jgi:hypothetical protein
MAKYTQGMVKLEADEKSGCINIYGKRNDGNVRQSDGLGLLITVDCTDTLDDAPFPPMLDEQKSNAELIAEAFNVAYETGMGPRQLADRVKDLERQLRFATRDPYEAHSKTCRVRRGKDYRCDCL